MRFSATTTNVLGTTGSVIRVSPTISEPADSNGTIFPMHPILKTFWVVSLEAEEFSATCSVAVDVPAAVQDPSVVLTFR